ncbi:MAG: hypothetical protein IJ796_11270 [Lachnospiraceae bacterium]|nr:hypothetical protein [Lachnospiraceae bacterium]
MQTDNARAKQVLQIVSCILIIIFTGLMFYMQVRFAFILEDFDYMKNLSTGEKLYSVGDIFESVSGIMAYGGSLLSGVILQFILLMGNGAANVINTLAVLLIAFLIGQCSGAKKTNMLYMAMPLFFMFSLNSDWKYSYLWEFGITGYVFPAIPFLGFLFIVFHEIAEADEKKNKGSVRTVFMCIFALTAGWANAAYGLVILFVSILAFVLWTGVLRLGRKNSMLLGGFFAGLGILLYMIPGGNFKSESVMSGQYIAFSIFPAVVLSLLMLAVVLRCGGWLNTVHLLLVGTMCFCVAIRFILQWIPGVSVNGIQVATLIVSIILFCSLIRSFNLISGKRAVHIWSGIITLCSFLYIVLTMLEDLGGVS